MGWREREGKARPLQQRKMPGSPRKERGESPQTGAKPGATQATAVTLGAQAAFWNLSLAVRKALISDEWREKEWWRGGASQAAFWNLSLAVRKALISDEWREKEWWRGGASQAAFWNLSLAV